MKFEVGGYYLVGDRVFQIRDIKETFYHCRTYDLTGCFKHEDYWSKNYIHAFVIKRVKPKGKVDVPYHRVGGKV